MPKRKPIQVWKKTKTSKIKEMSIEEKAWIRHDGTRCEGHVLCEMRYLQTLCMIWRGTPNRNNERFNPKFDRTQDIANCITTKLEMCTTMQDLPPGMTAHLDPLKNPNLDN